jgi:hypothetical protein
MDHLTDNEELKRDAPFLAGLPKADPFVVPDGFFERFPHQVQAALTSGQTAPTYTWTWRKRLAIALPILVVVCLGAWMFTSGSGPDAPSAVAVTPLTDNELDAIDDNEIFAAFDEADVSDITSEELGGIALRLNDDELLAYLENEDADITELITEIE